ncbi:MAG: hypothetical protein ABW278_14735 [Steroidobacteraceae bacterium]
MGSVIRQIVVGGVIIWAVAALLSCNKAGRQRRSSSDKLDKSLEDTYPASDPTATQDFAIPVNRL